MGLWGQGDGRAEGGPAEARLGHAAVAAAAEEGARLRRLPPAQAVSAPDVPSVRRTGAARWGFLPSHAHLPLLCPNSNLSSVLVNTPAQYLLLYTVTNPSH